VRVHIISDMEGVAGIVNSSQTNAGEPLFEEGRKLYTEEINAAVRGARAAGPTEVVVMDHHGAGEGFSFNSLVPEQLDPGCEYVVQGEWTSCTGFLEQGVDACLLVGMHAMAGTADGVLSHRPTRRGPGHGRRQTGILPRGARTLVPAKGRERIEAGAGKALSNLGAVAPYDPGRPCEIKVEYKTTTDPQELRYRRGVEILDSRRIVSRADDFWTAWTQFFF
jgi:D-amino peptidase